MQYIYCYFTKGKPRPRLHDDTCHLVVRRDENAVSTAWSPLFQGRQDAEQDMRAKNLEPIPCGNCIDRPSRRQL